MRLALILLLLPALVFAHGEEAHGTETESFFHMYPQMDVALYGFFALVVLGLFAVYFGKKLRKTGKKIAFALFAIISVAVTGYLVITTVQLNTISETGGPVHWHADFEVWACGERLELLESEGLANKIGTEAFHHHNDNRIHVEGVIVRKSDASLGKFFEAISGELAADAMTVPLRDGEKRTWRNGDLCNGKPGKVQVFVYKVNNPYQTKKWVFSQEKSGAEYVLSPHGNVPPGDCIIVDFGEEKERTERMCETYKVAMQKGEMHGG